MSSVLTLRSKKKQFLRHLCRLAVYLHVLNDPRDPHIYLLLFETDIYVYLETQWVKS